MSFYENEARALASGGSGGHVAAIAFAVLHLAEQVARVAWVLENGVVDVKTDDQR